MHLTRLTNLLYKTSRGHFNKQSAIALKELARNSVGTKNDTLSLQITQSIIQIELFTEQLDEVENTINDIMNSMDSVIKTIPGIGNLNGGMIIGEIGDIHRFESPCKLLAYAGLDPSVYQSGKFNASHSIIQPVNFAKYYLSGLFCFSIIISFPIKFSPITSIIFRWFYNILS